MQTEWRSFQGGAWETEVNVRDFIQKNYHPYDGDDSFLEGPTQDTTCLLYTSPSPRDRQKSRMPSSA